MGKIQNYYKSSIEETSIDSYGYNFLCIYGSHINGNYIAIINWGVSAELSSFPNDITYNAMSIAEVLEKIPQTKANASNIAYDIANAIAPRLKAMSDKENIKNDYVQEKLELFDAIIDNKCEIDGVRETIEELIDYGADENILIAMNFDNDDIDNVFEERKNEDIDKCE